MTVYQEGTILTLKKAHPCGSRDWLVLRPGLEYRLKCLGCGHVLLMNRDALDKAVKAVKEPAAMKQPEFRPIRSGEEEQVLEIISQAKAYLKGQGIDQWQKGYPDWEAIRRDRERGIGYCLTEGGRILAYTAVTFDQEASYETLEGGCWLNKSGLYGAMHRVAVQESQKGRGLAGRLVQEALGICRQKGAVSLRSDTHKENRSMRRMLVKNDFQYCGVIYLQSPGEKGDLRVAYERLLKA